MPRALAVPTRPGRARAWAWAAGAVAATAYLYAVDPNQPGRYLPCPTYALTGTYCPGCGGLRAAHALLHGDVVASLGFNPLVVPLLVLLAVGALLWVRRGRPTLRVDPSGSPFRLALGGVLLFWVTRNIPGWDWLSPA